MLSIVAGGEHDATAEEEVVPDANVEHSALKRRLAHAALGMSDDWERF
ncbi:MAG TPA: hypothetical protein VF427_10110 [Noviherbaspirillum sp.]